MTEPSQDYDLKQDPTEEVIEVRSYLEKQRSSIEPTEVNIINFETNDMALGGNTEKLEDEALGDKFRDKSRDKIHKTSAPTESTISKGVNVSPNKMSIFGSNRKSSHPMPSYATQNHTSEKVGEPSSGGIAHSLSLLSRTFSRHGLISNNSNIPVIDIETSTSSVNIPGKKGGSTLTKNSNDRSSSIIEESTMNKNSSNISGGSTGGSSLPNPNISSAPKNWFHRFSTRECDSNTGSKLGSQSESVSSGAGANMINNSYYTLPVSNLPGGALAGKEKFKANWFSHYFSNYINHLTSSASPNVQGNKKNSDTEQSSNYFNGQSSQYSFPSPPLDNSNMSASRTIDEGISFYGTKKNSPVKRLSKIPPDSRKNASSNQQQETSGPAPEQNLNALSKSVRQMVKDKRDNNITDGYDGQNYYKELSQADLNAFIEGIICGHVHPGQIGALLMAMRINGLNYNETSALTKAMLKGCNEFKWPDEWRNLIVDKVSTMGGLGDKVTLILVPALSACGLKVPKITRPNFESLIGLYSINNTIKKLESIPGFCVNCGSFKRIVEILDLVGCCIFTPNEPFIVSGPILDVFKDITATNDSIPLMAATLMSEKKAENISALVMDVKYGRGSPCKNKEQALEFSRTCVKLGNELGIKTRALLTKMGRPLGKCIGDALEVGEAISTLRGQGPEDLNNLACELGGNLLVATGLCNSAVEGSHRMRASLIDGTALLKFKEMLMIQGVDENLVNKLTDPEIDCYKMLRYNKLPFITSLQVSDSGYIKDMDGCSLASVYSDITFNNNVKGSVIHGLGIQILVDIGEYINSGDSWIKVYHDTISLSPVHMDRLSNSITLSPNKPDLTNYKIITDLIC